MDKEENNDEEGDVAKVELCSGEEGVSSRSSADPNSVDISEISRMGKMNLRTQYQRKRRRKYTKMQRMIERGASGASRDRGGSRSALRSASNRENGHQDAGWIRGQGEIGREIQKQGIVFITKGGNIDIDLSEHQADTDRS